MPLTVRGGKRGRVCGNERGGRGGNDHRSDRGGGMSGRLSHATPAQDTDNSNPFADDDSDAVTDNKQPNKKMRIDK